MAFPTNPVNLQEYTNALGTTYQYIAADTKWIIKTKEVVGDTGAQGFTGLRGLTGVQGLTGTQGATGLQGVTGIQGVTGTIGATGLQGVTGVFSYGIYNAGSFGTSGANINLSNGHSQYLSVIAGGSTGLIYLSGGVTGAKYSVEFRYTVNESPRGTTGIKWSPASPILSGYTGVKDMMYVYASGQDYIGVVSLGHSY